MSADGHEHPEVELETCLRHARRIAFGPPLENRVVGAAYGRLPRPFPAALESLANVTWGHAETCAGNGFRLLARIASHGRARERQEEQKCCWRDAQNGPHRAKGRRRQGWLRQARDEQNRHRRKGYRDGDGKKFARNVVCSAAVAAVTCAVACASIANIQDPAETKADPATVSPNPTGTSPETSPVPEASTQDVNTPVEDASADVQDATPDSAPPVCTKKQKGELCAAGSECCDGKCNEGHACTDDCDNGGDTCNPLDSTSCCIGFYCKILCAPCIAVARSLGRRLRRSPCCSRHVADGKCQ